MTRPITTLAIIFNVVGSVYSCAATNPGTTPTPTTTLSPVTTTTAAPSAVTTTTTPGVTTTTTASPTTTTTAAATACSSCTANQINFVQKSSDITINTSGTITTDANTGCTTMTTTCTADANMFAFMMFNQAVGGPMGSPDGGRTKTAALACTNGNWVYTSGGASVIVTEVSCNQASVP